MGAAKGHPLQILHPFDGHKNHEANTSYQKILRMNSLDGDFSIEKWDNKSMTGVYVELTAKDGLLLALHRKKRLRAPSCSIIFSSLAPITLLGKIIILNLFKKISMAVIDV